MEKIAYKMEKIAVVGICGQSVFLKAEKLPCKGESIACNGLHIEPGGKGVNTAVTIARLGGNVSFLTAVGDDDYGKKCIDFFEREHLNYTCIIKDNCMTDYGVIYNDNIGNNIVSIYLDASSKLNSTDVKNFAHEIETSTYVLLQAELSDEILLTVADICDKNKAKIIFDPSPVREIPKAFLDRVWLFTPNETEEAPLFEKYNPKRVIVTHGDKGAIYIENGESTHYSANEKLQPVNTTGAGDVFNAGLVYSLSQGNDIKQAIKFAIKAADFKVCSKYVVDGLPRLCDIK